MRTSLTFPEEFDSRDEETLGMDYAAFSDQQEAEARAAMDLIGPTIDDFVIADAILVGYEAVAVRGEQPTELCVTARSAWRRFEREFLLSTGKRETEGYEMQWMATFWTECLHQASEAAL